MKIGKDMLKIFILLGKAIVGIGGFIAAVIGIRKEVNGENSRTKKH